MFEVILYYLELCLINIECYLFFEKYNNVTNLNNILIQINKLIKWKDYYNNM